MPVFFFAGQKTHNQNKIKTKTKRHVIPEWPRMFERLYSEQISLMWINKYLGVSLRSGSTKYRHIIIEWLLNVLKKHKEMEGGI